MLNINQNFDLKAPVFNFDRDYFNSVEELNAYDTSNVPDHFVTNVAGMLYLFTDGKWLPMMTTRTTYNDNYDVDFGSIRAGLLLEKGTDNNFYPSEFSLWSEDEKSANFSPGYLSLRGKYDTNYFGVDATEMSITLQDENSGMVSTITTNGCEFKNNDDSTAGSIKILTNKDLTLEEQDGGYSPVDISLTDGDNSANINARHGFMHKTEDGFTGHLDGESLDMRSQINKCSISSRGLSVYDENSEEVIYLGSFEGNSLTLGSDKKFKISRPTDNTEGATITGVKSLTAFANPSATKVWATDGSTVDLSTKANTSDLDTKANASDVLLKKNSRGGYYIGDSNDYVGSNAFSIGGNTADGSNSFAAGYDTKAYGSYSHVEGLYTEARGESAHAEGDSTYANGNGSHSEGNYTHAVGSYSHSEGHNTYTNCYAAHAQGAYNIIAKNVIHSIGIGNNATRKNAEYIYAKANTNNTLLVDDPKNGYKYLIGVGGYDGISTDNSTYKSVQEVIADLTARIEQLETLVANCVSINNIDKQTN